MPTNGVDPARVARGNAGEAARTSFNLQQLSLHQTHRWYFQARVPIHCAVDGDSIQRQMRSIDKGSGTLRQQH